MLCLLFASRCVCFLRHVVDSDPNTDTGADVTLDSDSFLYGCVCECIVV